MSKKLNPIRYNKGKARKNEDEKSSVDYLSEEIIEGVRIFHQGFSEYSLTPLHRLDELAKTYGVKQVLVKDESHRFDLNAFKVLGGSYAIGKYLANELGVNISENAFEYFRSEEVKKQIGEITFVTATDGNHGRGVAWAAEELGQKSVVYMPKGSSKIRLENIRKEGAKASIIDGNYDDAVRLSNEMAKKYGWIVIQDTAWEGYEDIPIWIMQGYGTLIFETMEQLEKKEVEMPTHVFLQAGVGSFAGSILGYLVSKFGVDRPITVVIEPDDANCLYKSSLTGKREVVDGHMSTIMAGLACGEPNTISYEVLKDYLDGYISCPDSVAAKGMRTLGAPLKGDPQIISGESGAVGIGVLTMIMERNEYSELKGELKLDKDSIILLISTEGIPILKSIGIFYGMEIVLLFKF